MVERLVVRGTHEHNLWGAGIDLPRNKMVAFTGLSGSGKSSLAFDTIFVEGQCRCVESLNSYTRMFLGQVEKPDVEIIKGLSPTVSIDQKSTNRNPRSTVGTITEVYDYLRLLYARTSTPHCSICGEVISSRTPQQIIDQIMEMPEGTKFQVLASVVRTRRGEFVDLFERLVSEGCTRVVADGEMHRLASPLELKKQVKHDINVVIDRLQMKESRQHRLTDSVEATLLPVDGVAVIDAVGLEAGDPRQTQRLSEKMACPGGHRIAIDELEPRSSSFNSPYSACPGYDGIGTKLEVDTDLVIPDPSLPTIEAIAPWRQTLNKKYSEKLIEGLATEVDFNPTTPFEGLTAPQRKALLRGSSRKVTVRYRNRYGHARQYTAPFGGVMPYLHRKLSQAGSESQKDHFQGYMREVPCPACDGTRLRPEILSVALDSTEFGQRNIAKLTELSVHGGSAFLNSLISGKREKMIAGRVLREVQTRLKFLLNVDLDYLSLPRSADTLSDGRMQRIRLATQVGSGLVDVLYVLGELSIGLHQCDSNRLIKTLKSLRDLDNTLIVVEHDKDMIRETDWLMDIGPKAGEYGGRIVYQGEPPSIVDCEKSLTGAYLSGRRVLAVLKNHRAIDKSRIVTVKGARENSLKKVDVNFPFGVLTCVTGISGSGGSTLVSEVLAKVMSNRPNDARQVPGRHSRVEGLDQLDKLIQVDQSPIGHTPRSNPAAYTGVFDKIRNLFAEAQKAKVCDYKPGRFSFNVKGGRCEACKGDSTIKIEMDFLSGVYVSYEAYHGTHYNRGMLEVGCKGKTVTEMLDMPISEATEFFEPVQSIARYLSTLVDVDLGYVHLGQATTILSGSEAQRMKLANELQGRSSGRTMYTLDEPTADPHSEDTRKLMLVLQGSVNKGSTVIVIKHNLDVVKSADWIIDMGLEGGPGDGTVVVESTPEDVTNCFGSHTGQYLEPLLKWLKWSAHFRRKFQGRRCRRE